MFKELGEFIDDVLNTLVYSGNGGMTSGLMPFDSSDIDNHIDSGNVDGLINYDYSESDDND